MAATAGCLADVDRGLRRLLELQIQLGRPAADVERTRLLLVQALLPRDGCDDAAALVGERWTVPSLAPHVDTARGLVLQGRNDHAAAERLLRRGALRFVRQRGERIDGLPCPLQALGAFYRATGNLEKAESILRRSLADPGNDVPSSASIATCLELSQVLKARGRHDEALALIERAGGLARRLGTEAALLQVAAVLFGQDLIDRGRALLDGAADRYRASSDLLGLRRVALVYRNCGRNEDSARIFDEVWRRIDQGTAPITSYLGILVAEEYAVVLFLLDRRDDAARLTDRVPMLQHKSATDDGP